MIHRALRLLRVYHNLKQKDLAIRLGVSPSHLSEIESGGKGVSYDLLQKYSDVLKVPISTIVLFAEAADKPNEQSVVRCISDKALRLLEWLDTLTEFDADTDKSSRSRA